MAALDVEVRGTLSPSPRRPLGSRELGLLADDMAAHPALWRPLVRHDPADRWYVRLQHNPHFEVWLIGWETGQDTALHDHGGSSGAFAVCEGVLTEDWTDRATRLSKPRALRRRVRPAPSRRVFGPSYIHNLVNRGPGSATSIHVYSPPLSSMTYYERAADGTLAVKYTLPVAGPDPEITAATVAAGGGWRSDGAGRS
jgi:hypothetical protein